MKAIKNNLLLFSIYKILQIIVQLEDYLNNLKKWSLIKIN